MTFARPNLEELIARIRADLLSRLHADDVLRRADAEVYARVMAGGAHALYGYISWLADQVIYDTAEVEMLERWASIWGIARHPAVPATGEASFTLRTGAAIPVGTLMRSADGTQYQTVSEAAGQPPTATALIEAVTPGAAGNRATGETLTLISPVDRVSATVLAGALSGGADTESDDALRIRLLTRIQKPPHGGAKHDYEGWAREVPGVTRVWVFPLEMGLGTVTVRFVRDNDTDFIPGPDAIAAVQAHLDIVKPVTAQVFVVAPVPVAINFKIQLLPDTLQIREAVSNELLDLLLREAAPGNRIFKSRLEKAIALATGVEDFKMLYPHDDAHFAAGEIATLGEIEWQ